MEKIKRMFLLLVVVLFLVTGVFGCKNKGTQCNKRASFNKTLSEMSYVKDPRTDLCFAVHNGYRSVAMTEIGCEKIPARYLNQ